MSEANNETKKQDEKKREPYTVTVDPVAFEAEFEGRHMTSIDFCKLANELFHAAFADFDGSTFDFTNGAPMLSLYFNHPKMEDGSHYACERASGKTVGNSVIDKTRNRDLQLREGDRYHITDDGKDVIAPMLLPRFFNQGKTNWSTIVSDIVNRTATSYYQPQNVQHLTKIIGIDPRAITATIFGGTPVDYSIEVKSDLTRGMMMGQNPNYVLVITKTSQENLSKTYEKLGLGTIGSNIVR